MRKGRPLYKTLAVRPHARVRGACSAAARAARGARAGLRPNFVLPSIHCAVYEWPVIGRGAVTGRAVDDPVAKTKPQQSAPAVPRAAAASALRVSATADDTADDVRIDRGRLRRGPSAAPLTGSLLPAPETMS